MVDTKILALGAAGVGAVLLAGDVLGSGSGSDSPVPDWEQFMDEQQEQTQSGSTGEWDYSDSDDDDGLTAEDLAESGWSYYDGGSNVVEGEGTEDNPYQSLFPDAVEDATGVEVEDDLEAPGGDFSTIEEGFSV